MLNELVGKIGIRVWWFVCYGFCPKSGGQHLCMGMWCLELWQPLQSSAGGDNQQ